MVHRNKNAVTEILGRNSGSEVLTIESFLEKYAPSLKIDVSASSSSSAEEASSTRHDDDEVFLRTLVVPSDGCPPLLNLQKARNFQSLDSLVDGVVWSLLQRQERLRRQKQDGRNLLCRGFRIGAAGVPNQTAVGTATIPASSATNRGRREGQLQPEHKPLLCQNLPSGVVMTDLNHNVDYCKTSPLFRRLHARVGDDVLRMLLLHCSVFVPILEQASPDGGALSGAAARRPPSRGNYLQIAGPPLHATSGKIIASGPRSKPRRGRKRSREPAGKDWDERSRVVLPSGAVLSRKNLFYSERFTNKVGLPPEHVLNAPSADAKAVLGEMVDLFDDSGNIRRKRWRRVRTGGLLLCQEMIRRHKRTDYHRLLDRWCPLPSEFARKDELRQAVSLAEATASHTDASRVASFLRAVLRRVLPPSTLGCYENNWSQLLDHLVDHFVRLRRYEECANRNLTRGIRITKITWLFGGGTSPREGKKSRSDHQAAHELLTRVMRWVFGKFVIPLLSNCFYVTESEFSGRQVLYYRKPVWAVFRTLSMHKLLKEQYVEISAEEAFERLQRQEMGFSRLRLFPKETGVRPIAMLSKRENVEIHDDPPRKKAKIQDSKRSLSTNRILSDALSVLQYEHAQQDDYFGSGVDGLSYFYPRYRKFLEQRAERNLKAQPLYFASVDIERCYDSINQDHLLAMLEEYVLSEDDYIIQRYDVLYRLGSMGRVFRKQRKFVGPPDDFQQFSSSAGVLSMNHHDCVFVDGTGCSVKRKDELLKQLREHLTSNLVLAKGRHGDKYLLQSHGIPQGSVVSTLLCNLYYGNVEKALLPAKLTVTTNETPSAEQNCTLTSEPRHCHLLVRMVDDYLFITSDSNMFRSFLKTMYRGEPTLGVTVNPSKTRVSVPVSFQSEDGKVHHLQPDSDPKYFTWCGMLFNVESGETQIDYSRFQDGRGGNVLTVDHARQPGRHLSIAMKTFVRPRCIPILFDAFINSSTKQQANFYQLLVFAAVKTAEYIRSSNIVSSVGSNLNFLEASIDSAISYSYALVLGRLHRGKVLPRAKFSRPNAFWLGWNAFSAVFCRYGELLPLTTMLRERLDRVSVSKAVRDVAEESRRCTHIDLLA
jgi:telomerase reverse transcriptase